MTTLRDADGNVVMGGRLEEEYENYDQGCCPVCYNSGERTMEDVMSGSRYRFTLSCRCDRQGKLGAYHANSLLGLAWYVLTHRLSHLFAGDGWID